MRRTALLATLTLGIALPLQAQRDTEPQSLHGSKESVEKMYDFAVRHHLPFYLTPTNADVGIIQGVLVPLPGDSTYELTRGVGLPFASPEVRAFVRDFAPQYLAACGAPLTITSAERPIIHQPRNANPHSVHPTGIAVDIRRPQPGPCLTWVRGALATLEAKGYIEATEEHHPVHLHVAVLTEPGTRVALPRLYSGVPVPRSPVKLEAAPGVLAHGASDTAAKKAGAVATVPHGPEKALPGAPTQKAAVAKGPYRVRPGDTLWDIAGRLGTTPGALAAANGLGKKSRLKPGQTLTVPLQVASRENGRSGRGSR